LQSDPLAPVLRVSGTPLNAPAGKAQGPPYPSHNFFADYLLEGDMKILSIPTVTTVEIKFSA
jgi:hypothetical protein